MVRASVALSLVGSLGAFVAFCIYFISGYNWWCWLGCSGPRGLGAGVAVVLGLFGANLSRYRMPGAPLVLLAAGGVGFIDGDSSYLIVTGLFVLAAIAAWTSLDENAAGRARADE